jgi:hypothetical protein
LLITKPILSEKSNAGGNTTPDFKLYYRPIVIICLYWHKSRYEVQWNRIENPDMNPHSYAYLIFDKGTKNIRWSIDSLFNKCCLEKWLSACRKLDPGLSPCASINSKWIKDLNIRPKTLKLVQERTGNTLEAIGIEGFLNRIPAAQKLRERMYNWDYMKLKRFCTMKEIFSKLKRPPTEWEKYLLVYMRQRTDNKNIQGAQKTKLPKNQ